MHHYDFRQKAQKTPKNPPFCQKKGQQVLDRAFSALSDTTTARDAKPALKFQGYGGKQTRQRVAAATNRGTT
jgi:hypothetical protein